MLVKFYMRKQKLIFASAYAAIITNDFVVIITIGAELFAPLKNWLKNFSGHHWVSKSILSALLYAVATILFYFIFRNPNETRIRKSLILLFASLILGIAAISLFFTGHHFKLF